MPLPPGGIKFTATSEVTKGCWCDSSKKEPLPETLAELEYEWEEQDAAPWALIKASLSDDGLVTVEMQMFAVDVDQSIQDDQIATTCKQNFKDTDYAINVLQGFKYIGYQQDELLTAY